MKLGLDFWNCISQYPDLFRKLAQSIIMTNGEVYIISAYGDRQLAKYDNDKDGYLELIKSYRVPCDSIELVYFGDNDKTIPEMKLEVAQRLGLDMMIDDRPSTIQLFHENGICAMQVPKPLKA